MVTEFVLVFFWTTANIFEPSLYLFEPSQIIFAQALCRTKSGPCSLRFETIAVGRQLATAGTEEEVGMDLLKFQLVLNCEFRLT